MSESVHYLSIETLQKGIREETLSPVAIVEALLSRIDKLNPQLNAFARVLKDEARDEAKRAEAEISSGKWRGPLHGVPVGIKDFYDTAGIPTTAAFDRFKNRVPSKDAVAVRKLKEAGAIAIGKMNMHSLGMGTTGLESLFGPARNPWDARYIPGGSSSGSAAAVAAGLCYATLDTDAIGSCRLPAACCGVIGLKGSYGAISTEGILAGEPVDDVIRWFSHAGITSRSVADAALTFTALAGPDYTVTLAAGPGSRFTIGVPDGLETDEEVMRAFQAAVDALGSMEHELRSAKLPADVPPFGDLHAIEADRRLISQRAFREIDVLVLPTIPTVVPAVEQAKANQQSLSPAHTVFANYFGLPAITVPCGFDGKGLPIGLQILGKPRGESSVLDVARQYEAVSPAAGRRPIP